MVEKDSFDIAQKLLAYIHENEPVDNIKDLLEKSGVPEDTIKLNLERLHNSGLIEGHLIKTLGSRYFVQVNDLRLSYIGLKELSSLAKPIHSEGVSVLPIHIGEMEFNFNLAKLF